MHNQTSSANHFNILRKYQEEKTKQIETHLSELHEQTASLSDLRALTLINIECIKNIVNLTSENTKTVKQIALMTAENQKSSTKQFWASIIVSASALIVAGASLFVSIIQLHK